MVPLTGFSFKLESNFYVYEYLLLASGPLPVASNMHSTALESYVSKRAHD